MVKLLASHSNKAMDKGKKKWCRKIHNVWETNLHQVAEREMCGIEKSINDECGHWLMAQIHTKNTSTSIHSAQSTWECSGAKLNELHSGIWLCISLFNEHSSTIFSFFFSLNRQFSRAETIWKTNRYRNRLYQEISLFLVFFLPFLPLLFIQNYLNTYIDTSRFTNSFFGIKYAEHKNILDLVKKAFEKNCGSFDNIVWFTVYGWLMHS